MKAKLIFQCIGVLLLAFIACSLLSVLTDFLLESIGILPPPSNGLHDTGLIILVLFYRGIYTIFSGYLLGWLSPVRPIILVTILGVAGTLLPLLALLDPTFSEKAPLWFVYTLSALTFPALCLGVKIYLSRN